MEKKFDHDGPQGVITQISTVQPWLGIVTLCSVFPSSCNIRLQEWEPCHPIKLQKDLNSALSLAHTVDAVATGSCKNLEKRCIRQMGGHYFTERNGIEWFHHIIPRNGTAVRSNQTIQTELKSMYISLPPVSKVYVTSTRMLRTRLWATKMETLY